MKKIIIVPTNTDLNRGDQALIWESINIVRDVFNDNVEISLIGNKNNIQTSQTKILGYDFLDPILKHPSRVYKNKKSNYGLFTILVWGSCAVFDFIRTKLLTLKYPFLNKIGELFFSKETKCTLNYIKECDAVFVKGGGFLHSYGSFFDIYLFYYYLFILELAIRYNKKIFILPNSIGPLNNKIARKYFIKIINKCSLVCTRETISQSYVKNYVKEDIYNSLDLAYYLKPSDKNFRDYLLNKGIPIDGNKNIIITLRPYRFPNSVNPQKSYENYLNSIIEFVKNVYNKGYTVTFFAHTLGPSEHENDYSAIESVLEKLSIPKVFVLRDYSLTSKDVEKIYSYFNYMIGTRFHSVIFALNVNIPTIAITYGGNKGDGIMADLGISDYTIKIEEISYSLLNEKFNLLIKNKEGYLNRIKDNKVNFNERRLELVNLIRHKFEGK